MAPGATVRVPGFDIYDVTWPPSDDGRGCLEIEFNVFSCSEANNAVQLQCEEISIEAVAISAEEFRQHSKCDDLNVVCSFA